MSVLFIPTHQPAMDPRYQHLQARHVNTKLEPTFESANKGYLPVLAKISNLENWKALTEVKHGIEIKNGENWIVTARIPFTRFEALSKCAFVESLTLTSPLQPLLAHTIQDVGLGNNHGISEEIYEQAGKGVMLGIVDFGCDFAHQNFKKGENKTRIHSIWNQNEKAPSDGSVSYGRIYTKADINNALTSGDPYTTLGYCPGEKAHGTHVMDIAAGNGPYPGIAPKSRIIFVELGIEPDRKLADSVRLVEAVKYIFDKAGDKPCVVNLSLGQYCGAHDGTGLVEQALDAMVNEQSNRMIVIAAGNSYTEQSHVSGCVKQNSFFDVEWTIKPLDSSENELEIWYSGKDEFEIEIFKEDISVAKVPLDSNGFLLIDRRERMAFISHRKHDSRNNDNVIQIFQDPSCELKGGVLTLRLHGKNIQGGGKFHAWIERKVAPSVFEKDSQDYTIGSIATGHKTIVAGSYDANRKDTPLSWFSSAGPTRDERRKPEVSAPGHEVWAASSKTKHGTIQMSGTSMAAPVVTGLVARILGQAYVERIPLAGDKIREILFQNCRKDILCKGIIWDPRYGYGRLHASSLSKCFEEKPSDADKEETVSNSNKRPLDDGGSGEDGQPSTKKLRVESAYEP